MNDEPPGEDAVPSVTKTRSEKVSTSESVDLARGAALGRYIVLERLRRGGVGGGYAGHDPELGRELAVESFPAQGGGARIAVGGRAPGGGGRPPPHAVARARV